MKSRRTLENGEVIIYTSSYSFHPERIEFSETDEKRVSGLGGFYIASPDSSLRLNSIHWQT
jgi:hypothetical protein